jgi:hypothetical protein
MMAVVGGMWIFDQGRGLRLGCFLGTFLLDLGDGQFSIISRSALSKIDQVRLRSKSIRSRSALANIDHVRLRSKSIRSLAVGLEGVADTGLA